MYVLRKRYANHWHEGGVNGVQQVRTPIKVNSRSWLIFVKLEWITRGWHNPFSLLVEAPQKMQQGTKKHIVCEWSKCKKRAISFKLIGRFHIWLVVSYWVDFHNNIWCGWNSQCLKVWRFDFTFGDKVMIAFKWNAKNPQCSVNENRNIEHVVNCATSKCDFIQNNQQTVSFSWLHVQPLTSTAKESNLSIKTLGEIICWPCCGIVLCYFITFKNHHDGNVRGFVKQFGPQSAFQPQIVAVPSLHARNWLVKTSFCTNTGWCFGTVHCDIAPQQHCVQETFWWKVTGSNLNGPWSSHCQCRASPPVGSVHWHHANFTHETIHTHDAAVKASSHMTECTSNGRFWHDPPTAHGLANRWMRHAPTALRSDSHRTQKTVPFTSERRLKFRLSQSISHNRSVTTDVATQGKRTQVQCNLVPPTNP